MDNKKFTGNSFLFAGNAVFIDELYQLYLADPSQVDSSWQEFFQNFSESNARSVLSTANVIEPSNSRNPTIPATLSANVLQDKSQASAISSVSDNELLRLKAAQLVAAYRELGHHLVYLDPLNLQPAKNKSELKLTLDNFAIKEQELNVVMTIDSNSSSSTVNIAENLSATNLAQLINTLETIYCQDVAVEFQHINDLKRQEWLYSTFERLQQTWRLNTEKAKKVLQDILETEWFEQYIHTKFPGAKRFSIEGGEVFNAALEYLVTHAAELGIEDIVMGMAHRGRLATLTKTVKQPYQSIFAEFSGKSVIPSDLGVAGDVKYHLGYSSTRNIAGRNISISLLPNPSHLEAIDPVLIGYIRAKQDCQNSNQSNHENKNSNKSSIVSDSEKQKILGILVHGDAAFCGQGVVFESLMMNNLASYHASGIIHFVINNQVGFTADSSDGHPGHYATDIAKVIGAPILHVNGDNVEAVIKATHFALQYRQKFSQDIIIEIICYRKYGHNEGDEPAYTQPIMYNVIRAKETVGNMYAQSLLKDNTISQQELEGYKNTFRLFLDNEFTAAKNYKPQIVDNIKTLLQNQSITNESVVTGVQKDKLLELGAKLCDIPADFAINDKLNKLFNQRRETLKQDSDLDWATAEQLAFATLLIEGRHIRITGQDAERGTFSHRHSVLHNTQNGSIYVPLNHLSSSQGTYNVANSHLSEFGVLGFEYGYSLLNHQNLTIWEAQFGDFANGAQIIFDQFISSAKTKWLQFSNLVVLLPHSFEGQGPEHSSARLERFLQLAADNNMSICYPTTPAAIFHLLRRQVHTKAIKPLVIMSPKSLLRHKLAVSKLDNLTIAAGFQSIIDETEQNIVNKISQSQGNINRVILCSGKVYYDLLEKRQTENITDTVIIRIEELYPLDNFELLNILQKYGKASDFIWCQEEPQNMGAWSYIKDRINQLLMEANIPKQVAYVGRKAGASPAIGSLYQHNTEQKLLLQQAFNIQ